MVRKRSKAKKTTKKSARVLESEEKDPESAKRYWDEERSRSAKPIAFPKPPKQSKEKKADRPD